MKKIIIVLLLFLTACTPDKEITNKIENDTLKVNCISEIQTPYIDVWSPVYDQQMIYMGASDRDINANLKDTRLLVEYNIETKKSQVLFESQFKSANIQGIKINDNWLVWEDMEISGTQDNIYVMNRKTKAIKKINSIKTEAPSFTIPVLVNDSIFWIEEEKLVNNEIQSSIKKYDCNSGKIEVISKLNSIGVHNIYLERNGDRLLWSDTKDNQSIYCIYDINTQEKDIIPATLNATLNPILVGNNIVSMESTSQSGNYELYIYNTKTKKSRKNNQYINGYYQFDDFILCNDGLITSLFSINEDLSITSRMVFNNQSDNYTLTNGEYVIFNRPNDEGTILFIYALKAK